MTIREHINSALYLSRKHKIKRIILTKKAIQRLNEEIATETGQMPVGQMPVGQLTYMLGIPIEIYEGDADDLLSRLVWYKFEALFVCVEGEYAR